MPRWILSGFADEISNDPHVQLPVLLGLGAKHVEVLSAWGINVAELSEEETSRFASMLDEHGVAVSAIGSPVGKSSLDDPLDNEVARLDRVMDIAERLGTGYVRIFSFFVPDGSSHDALRAEVMDRMSTLAQHAERRGIVLLHENEKGIYGDIPKRGHDLVTTVNSPALRLTWDSANFVQLGVKPFTDGYELLAPYVDYLQIKDALFADRSVVPAGEGDGELRETLAAFARDGFEGFASLEPHLPSDTDGFPGAFAFGRATRALRRLTDEIGIELS